MELKNVLNFLRRNSGTSQPSIKTRKTSCVPLKKPARKLMNSSVTTRVGSTLFEDFEAAFAVFEQIQIQLSHIGNYSFMPQTTDFGDEAFAEIAQAGMDFETWASVELSFFDDALVEADEDVLERLGQLLTSLLPFVRLKSKKLTT